MQLLFFLYLHIYISISFPPSFPPPPRPLFFPSLSFSFLWLAREICFSSLVPSPRPTSNCWIGSQERREGGGVGNEISHVYPVSGLVKLDVAHTHIVTYQTRHTLQIRRIRNASIIFGGGGEGHSITCSSSTTFALFYFFFFFFNFLRFPTMIITLPPIYVAKFAKCTQAVSHRGRTHLCHATPQTQGMRCSERERGMYYLLPHR